MHIIQEAQLSLGWADHIAYIRMPASDIWLRKESDFPEWLQSHAHYGDAAMPNATIKAKIRYSNSMHMDDGCRQQYGIQNIVAR